ncbi:hypothetical protein B0O80DRAFT_190381 [Mortierella sp. GBAus27b]|nr:hypothetical protein B0O80DRAFT_190381 [Mortierella sp. GBAus27b]
MGVRGLSKIIKDSGGTLAHDLKSKPTHVDFPSLLFALQAQCFRGTSADVAKEARALDSTASTSFSPSHARSLDSTTSMSVNPCPASTSGDGATTTYIAEDKYTIITTLRKRRTVDSPHPKPKRRKTESLMNDVKEHACNPVLFIGPDGRITPNPPEKSQSARQLERWVDFCY